MIEAGDFKNGVAVIIDGQVHQVLEFQHVKPGRGQAFVRAKIKNLETGATVNRTFRPDERFPLAHIEKREMQYLYDADGQYFFMDTETYDQVGLGADQLGDAVQFLKEGMVVKLLQTGDKTLGVELPTAVDLKVVETEPGVRGDTAQGGSKPAKLETGAVVQVPLFVNAGDVIRVDTRTGEYVERVS
ncbi:translation elongation factor P (EF-P) [Thermaerobacter marianensis DSM 12885]|uniref:Elongation factor P n=1 Tax=Thermaerobacter marianensis (strain ATCC 700841 / DSM 12885 / JCM 10246 / 7p75a) TaxID=644966 RepID=E6SL68_THEM7|nr:elongation factor P [Thermaerobacter marianensis]ADU51299.1 translation elongation factor P (EF-P) [Thermaerobacter marianensis DSM 12885]